MQLKNQKRAMMLLMSLMLSTTGCSNNTSSNNPDYKASSYEEVSNIIDEYDFYQKDYSNVKDNYANLYENYLDNFIDYMSEEQYHTFIKLVENMNREERNAYPESLNYLNSMFGVTDNSYGRGFFKIFNSRVISENIDFMGIVGGNLSNHINTLAALTNNKEEFYESIFSGDINNVIDCICKNTGFANRELVEELIIKMDLYTDILTSEYYMDQKVKVSYEERINEIIYMIIEAKCENDHNFSKSFYAALLKESEYYGIKKYAIIPGITVDTFSIDIYENGEVYSISDIAKSHLYEETSIEKIRELAVNDILNRSLHLEDEKYFKVADTAQLLMCLLESSPDFEDIKNSDDFRKNIYKNLSKYFTSEDEFNIFILKIYNSSPSALEQYFAIFMDSIQVGGITYEDFLRYNALVNYNNRRKHINIDYVDSNNYVASEKLVNMTEEEYQAIASSREENYFIGFIDYQKYFNKIEKILCQNNLCYEMVFNKDYTLDWDYGLNEIASNVDTSVISSAINPEMMEFNGTYVIYYEYPPYYEDGEAVEVFTNINNETSIRNLSGFKAEIINPKSGEPQTIFVVDMNSSKDGYKPIRFMINYKDFCEKRENIQNVSMLTLGGQNE